MHIPTPAPSRKKTGPAGSELLIFYLFWSVMTAISLLVDCLFWSRILDYRQTLLILFAAIAAFITAMIACFLEHHLTRHKPASARFALMSLLLATGTMGATYLGSALYTILFFLEGTGPLASYHGLEDLLFFFLAHGYSFAVSTARLFLPLGFVALLLTAIFYCILCRSTVTYPKRY